MLLGEIVDTWLDEFFSTLPDGQAITPEQALPQLLGALTAGMNEGDEHAEIILRLWMWNGAVKAVEAAVTRRGARMAWDESDPRTMRDELSRFLGIHVGIHASEELDRHDNE